MSRAMTEWVMRMLPPAAPPDVPVVDAITRDSLIKQFLDTPAGWHLAQEIGSRIVSSIGEMLVNFATDYGTGDPLEWSPTGVDGFFRWWTDKVIAPDLEEHLPEVTEAWVDFALTRKGLARKFVAAVVEAAHEFGDDFCAGSYNQLGQETDSDDFDDFGVWGPIGLWGSRVDITDEELPLVVGGGDGVLEGLNDDPLPAEDFQWSGVPGAIHQDVAEILALIDRGADVYPDGNVEVSTAQRRLLARAAMEAPEWFSAKAKPTGSASAICWLIGRANDLLSAYGPVTAAGLAAAVGASGSPSQRASRLQKLLGMRPGITVSSSRTPDCLSVNTVRNWSNCGTHRNARSLRGVQVPPFDVHEGAGDG